VTEPAGSSGPPADPARCSDGARARGDSPRATAPPAHRLLLLEVPGSWGRAGLTASRLPAAVTGPLARRADLGGVRVQLIRRPGRHPWSAGPLRWAVADPDAGAVHWGDWTDPAQLAELDLHRAIDPAAAVATGPQRLVLVCTHAGRDVCCAVRGRPVAAALLDAAALRPGAREVWETSHLGADRFAGNLLALPEGELFGGLDVPTARDAVRLLDAGRLALPHYRGRIGRPPAVQAALHLAAEALGDDRLGAVRVLELTGEGSHGEGSGGQGSDWQARVGHDGRVYRLRLSESWAPPHRLTCRAVEPKPARRFALVELVELRPEELGVE
jgi:hypothetical protein